MNKREVEIRIRLTADERLDISNKLEKSGWLPKESAQIDTYYCAELYVNEERTKECPYIVRIRTQASGSKITFKSFTADGSWSELESEISDALSMSDILTKLGQQPYLTINKNRLCGRLGDVEVNIDEIEGLGSFMELELISDDVDNARLTLLELAKNLGLQEEDVITKGYVQLMEEVKR